MFEGGGMPEGATGSAKENAAWRIERWGLASLRFVGDFWLLFLITLVLGALFVLVPQGQEIWRYYILSPAPGPSQVGWVLMHAVFVAAGFLFTGVVLSRYALRRVLFRQEQGRPPALWTVPGAALLPLILGLAGIACAAGDYLAAELVGARMLAAVCIAAGLIVVAVAAVVALGLTGGAGGFADLVGRHSTSVVTAVVAVLLLIMFLGLPWLPEPVFVSSAQLVGALPALLLSLALVIYGVDAAFRAIGPGKVLAIGLLVLVGVGVLFGDMATAHRVRRVGEVAKQPLPDVGSEFLRWLETRKDNEKYASGHYPVFIVAAQGGGLYAAHHTGRVLAILQDECPAFAQHVFAISGVSGGSLGAAVFASAVKSLAPEQTLQPCRMSGSSTKFLEYTDSFLARDFLSPAAFLSVVPNIAQRVLGLPWTVLGMVPEKLRKALRVSLREQRRGVTQYDRALGLEYGFEQAWRDAEGRSGKATGGSNFFTSPSTAAWSGEDAVPALIFNAARADTGVTYAVAPFRLDNVPFLDFRAKVLGYEAPNADVRISTGVGLSSRVPFITGPGVIRVAGRRWLERDDSKFETIGLVDGAYVENSGTATLGELLREIHNAVVKRGNRKVKIIVVAIQDLSAFTYSHSGIEGQPGERKELLPDDLRDLVEKKDFERPIRYGFAEFTAPLAALNASRTARSFYTLNSLVETIVTLRCAQGVADSKEDGRCAASQRSRSGEIIDVEEIGHALFGFTANNRPLPLAWLLSSLSRERIEKRTWVGTHQSWRCEKQNAIPIEGKKQEAMSEADIAELRGLGEDLGGFVDRWIYACGRDHVRGALGG
jgi:hypothetical protein